MGEPKKRYIEKNLVDADTGEEVDVVLVPRSQTRHWNRGGFCMAMLDAFDEIADENWPAGDYQVFVKLVGRLKWENDLLLNVSDLAKEMGRSRESVSRAISRFVKRGILHRGPRVGAAYSYRLDPSMAWRGKAEARARVEREIRDRQWTVHDGGGK